MSFCVWLLCNISSTEQGRWTNPHVVIWMTFDILNLPSIHSVCTDVYPQNKKHTNMPQYTSTRTHIYMWTHKQTYAETQASSEKARQYYCKKTLPALMARSRRVSFPRNTCLFSMPVRDWIHSPAKIRNTHRRTGTQTRRHTRPK